MSEKILIYGCGDLAWGQSERSPFGDEWLTGHLREGMDLPEGGADAVSLGDELDGHAGSWPAQAPPKVRIEVHRARGATTSILPPWEDLVENQASRVTQDLRGPGVLVTPTAWSKNLLGRQFLHTWGRQGWRWASLEEVLACSFASEARFVSAGSIWLRIHEPGGTTVVPNGAEASCALELTSQVLNAVLGAVSPELAAEWRAEEEAHSGWFTRHQILRSMVKALRDGRRSAEVGGPEGPIFRFSGADAARRFAEFTALRMTIDLPQLSAAIWWEQIADPSFLKAVPGTKRPALRWEAMETVLIGNLQSEKSSAPPELRPLHTYLRFNGRPFQLVDPVTLRKAGEIGNDLDRVLARWEEADRSSAEAVTVPNISAKKSRKAKKSFRTGPPPGETEVAASDSTALGEKASPAEAGGERASGLDLTDEEGQEYAEEATPEDPQVAEKRAADPLADFSPEILFLEQPHRRDSLRVVIDGDAVSPENLVPIQRVGERSGYLLKGLAVSHGAIVRLDFEPE